jgi:TatD DNase family protein
VGISSTALIPDYDRLHHSPAAIQLKYLPRLLELSKRFDLPMFLHSRHPDAHRDLVRILREADWGVAAGWKGAVVHSFTGTVEEMQELVGCLLHRSE